LNATPLWSPSAESIETSRLTAYSNWLREQGRGPDEDGYEALWAWSTERPEEFWESLWDYFDVIHDGEYDRVLSGHEMPGARWFEGTRLNYAEHIFRDRDPDAVAIIERSESQTDLNEYTWGTLEAAVAIRAASLRELGVGPGDRVAGYLPNTFETIALFLAVASLGAVWSCCSPDFGAGAVRDRFAQIEPKILLATDGYTYGGKEFDRRATVIELAESMPSIEKVVFIGQLGDDPASGLPEGTEWDEDRFMNHADFLTLVDGAELEFTRVPFDSPLWILYSSGTTGLPKPIVQGQGGILLEHLKKMNLHVDARPGDRIFWFTTTGWMMWNFLVSCLLADAAIVLYDGNPGYPDMSALWQLASDAEVTCFGTSASFISACMKDGVEPGADGRDLSKLRAVGSTGSPLSPEGFDWIYEHVGADTWLFSTSGGTDLCTAFVGGVPTLPVYRGELQARALGAAVESWDEDGNPHVGEVGELVITKPMPSMPLYLWGDEDGSRYHDSYFDTYPGIWRHGDWIEITDRGTAIIYGRSDSTINRGGIRMGTSEIYRAVLADDDIADALVVDIPREGTEGWMPLFVVLAEGAELTDELKKRVAAEIRTRCSPRHVPNEMIRIEAVPRTLSGKVLEVPVKRILTGTPPEKAASRDSLANPEALDFFSEYARQLNG
jgi:acetoacetyl-CoA synthetase